MIAAAKEVFKADQEVGAVRDGVAHSELVLESVTIGIRRGAINFRTVSRAIGDEEEVEPAAALHRPEIDEVAGQERIWQLDLRWLWAVC